MDLSVQNFDITETDWETSGSTLSELRRQVFIVEQSVPKEEEWDGKDEDSLHWLATLSGGEPIGTARLLPDGQIGRMAVLQDHRKKGVGAALLERAVEKARTLGYASVYLHSQSHAKDFYRKAGFKEKGDEFFEAGIAHVYMNHVFQENIPENVDKNGLEKNLSESSGVTGTKASLELRDFDVLEVDWPLHSSELAAIRELVFEEELDLPASDVNQDEEKQYHWLARLADGTAAGVVSMNSDGLIRQLAVLPAHRRHGIGSSLVDTATIKASRLGLTQIVTNALDQSLDFFSEAGFLQSDYTNQQTIDPYQQLVKILPFENLQNLRELDRQRVAGEDEEDNVDGILGRSRRQLILRTEEEFCQTILDMCLQARMNIRIHSPLLDHKLYDKAELEACFSALARKNKYTFVEILVYDSHRMVKNGHHLLEISRKLSSSIKIKLAHPDYQSGNHEYLLVDNKGFIFRQNHERFEGIANYNNTTESDRYTRQFARSWESSLDDPGLRTLKI